MMQRTAFTLFWIRPQRPVGNKPNKEKNYSDSNNKKGQDALITPLSELDTSTEQGDTTEMPIEIDNNNDNRNNKKKKKKNERS